MNDIPWRWVLYSCFLGLPFVQTLHVIITMDRDVDLFFYPHIQPIEQSPKQELYLHLPRIIDREI